MAFPCNYCLKIPTTASIMQRCSKCRAVYYCSRECQAKDWGRGHKELCKIACMAKLKVMHSVWFRWYNF